MSRPTDVLLHGVLVLNGFNLDKRQGGQAIWVRTVTSIHGAVTTLILGIEEEYDAAILTAITPGPKLTKIAEGTVSDVCSSAVVYASELGK